MADQACIDAIIRAAPHLSREDAARIDDAVADFKKRKQAQAALGDITADVIDYARRQADEARMAAYIEKRNRAKNIIHEQELSDFILADGRSAQRLGAALVGDIRGFRGAARSVDAEAHAIESDLVTALSRGLSEVGAIEGLKGGLMGLRRNVEFERQVANELARLTDSSAGADTGNKLARQAAEVIHKTQEAARQMQNDAGAWIGQMPGYIVRQSHDQYKVAKAAGARADDDNFQAWRNFVMPLLDERTFEGVGDREQFLRGVWVNLATGNHLKPEAVGSMKDPAFKGPGNLAKRTSAERLLHFKNADAWFDYNERFGAGNLIEAAYFGLRRAAQNTALMRRFGTNPELMFENVRQRAILEAKKRGDTKEVSRLEAKSLRRKFDVVTGLANQVENVTLARWSNNIRGWNNMAALGGVVLSSITDIPNAAATLRHNGVTLLNGYADLLKGLTSGKNSTERKIAESIGFGLDSMTSEMLSRFSANDTPSGKISKAQDVFFRLNLLSQWTNGRKAGVAAILAKNLADHAGTAFDALPELLRNNLQRYDIDGAKWDVIREAVGEVNGTKFVATDMVDAVDGARLAPLIEKPLSDYRAALHEEIERRKIAADQQAASALEEDLDQKIDLRREQLMNEARTNVRIALQTYYVDQVNEALNVPGAAEQVMMTLGLPPGSVAGEAIRFIMQFKSFPLTFTRRHIGREVLRYGAMDVGGIVHLMVATTVFGYLAMAAKDLARGREPRDPNSARTWAAALVQGGGLGIYGDFLMGEYNRVGGGPFETLSGPTVGYLSQAAGILSQIRDGALQYADTGKEPTDPSGRLFNLLRNNAPFINLFYTRVALDYLFLYQISEMLNPGYLRRMERSAQREQGTTFIVPPSQAIPYGGGGGLFEGVR